MEDVLNTNWKRSLAGVCLIALGSACGGESDAGALEGAGEMKAGLSAQVVTEGPGGVPTFIRGDFGSVKTSLARSGLRGKSLAVEAEQALAPVLRGVAPLFRLSPKELRVRSARVDEVDRLLG